MSQLLNLSDHSVYYIPRDSNSLFSYSSHYYFSCSSIWYFFYFYQSFSSCYVSPGETFSLFHLGAGTMRLEIAYNIII